VLFEQSAKPTSCPAGMCTSNPGCADAACPGHPGLRRVQLLSLGKHKPDRGVLFAVLVACFKGCVMAFAVVGVLSTCVPATSADTPAPVFSKPTKVTT
jgi:hypothetical protein